MSVDEQLAWEGRQRSRAALIAVAAAVTGIASLVVYTLSTGDTPKALLLDSLRSLEKPGPIGHAQTAKLLSLQHARDTAATGYAWRILTGLSVIGAGLAIGFLGACTRARRERTKRAVLRLTPLGGAFIALGVVLLQAVQLGLVADVLDGARTVDATRQTPSAGNIASGFLILGLLTFAVGGVSTCLNAMRAGLLTRVMGIVGMFAAVSPMLIGLPQPLLPLWTAFLVPLFVGRWPGGQPPAWITGKEEPWPSAQEMRNEKLRAQGKLAEPDPTPVERAAKPHPSSKKRKRKRRN